MRTVLVTTLMICLLAVLPATVQAQSNDQQMSAEEFLSQGAAPAPASDAATPIDDKAAELFGDSQRKREMSDRSIVKLRTIDKLSARTHTFEIPVGKTVKFGKSLFIKARACRSASPLDEPENAAFLQIWERLPEPDPRTGDESRWIFSGWMFSSSPSLSAMEHPIYDVWVIECKNDATVAQAETYSAEKAPETKPEDAAAAAPETKDDEKPVAAETPPAAATPAATSAAEGEPHPDAEQMAPVSPVSGGSAAMPSIQELPGSFEDGDDEQ